MQKGKIEIVSRDAGGVVAARKQGKVVWRPKKRKMMYGNEIGHLMLGTV